MVIAGAMRAWLAPLTIPPPVGKPRFRGTSHQIGAFAALAATCVLLLRAVERGQERALACLVFGASLTTLLAVSAVYHRINWKPGPRAWMRRLDHAAIFLLIAGGYTPLFALVPSPSGGHLALWGIWTFAAVGVTKSLVWAHAPKWVTAALCVGMGWTVAGEVAKRASAVGAPCIWLLVAAGLTYSAGAVVYALKRPKLLPATFGYHEVFHALVLLASVALFAHVVLLLSIA